MNLILLDPLTTPDAVEVVGVWVTRARGRENSGEGLKQCVAEEENVMKTGSPFDRHEPGIICKTDFPLSSRRRGTHLIRFKLPLDPVQFLLVGDGRNR